MNREAKLSRKTKETETGMRGEKVYGMYATSVIKLYDKVLIKPSTLRNEYNSTKWVVCDEGVVGYK